MNRKQKPIISIIIPMVNEEKYIEECLRSVLNSDYDLKRMEVLLIDGMSTDRTREIVHSIQKECNFCKLIENPKKIVPVAMNLGIKEAKGDYIIRLDAHAQYPKNYFSKLIDWHENIDAANIGTTIITEVKNKTKKSNSIKDVLSHKLGVGNSLFRLSVNDIIEADTVPYGCFPRKTFEKYGYYDERLVRNQDIELNKRIKRLGGKIYLIPNIQCTYYARENFTALAKNNYSNGFWNVLTAYYTKTFTSLSLRHFIPLLFVLSLVVPFFTSLFFPQTLWIAAISFVSYLALVIIISIKMKNNSTNVLYLIVSFLTLHLSYGVGSLMGIISVINKYIKGGK